jgi:hypothetical protein
MSEPSQGLQVGEDLEFKRRSLKAQKIGWVIMAAALVAGAFGLLGGSGLFVRTSVASSSEVISVHYPRFLRVRTPIDVHVNVYRDAVDANEIRITVDRAFLQQFEIHHINPVPSNETISDSSITYTISVSPEISDAVVTFNLEAEYAGISRGRITVDGEPEIEFWQVVYP